MDGRTEPPAEVSKWASWTAVVIAATLSVLATIALAVVLPNNALCPSPGYSTGPDGGPACAANAPYLTVVTLVLTLGVGAMASVTALYRAPNRRLLLRAGLIAVGVCAVLAVAYVSGGMLV